jgi:CheY-like chemotaxis protein
MAGNRRPFLYIVVADDNPDDHDLIKEAVRECNQNHIVTSVYNGQQLLDLLHHREFYKIEQDIVPDLILLDLLMPITSGLEALEEIKSVAKLKNIPVYVLTAFDSNKDLQRAMELGATSYFMKPLRYQELHEVVREICEHEAISGNR